jgi:hypothetical protein
VGKAFYGSLLGWTFGDSHEGYTHVSNTNLPLGLKKDPPADLSSLYFCVNDVEQAVEQVRALGGTANDIFKSEWGRAAICTDDQGTKFTLWQPATGY